MITTWVFQEAPYLRNRVSSYRAGFLPEERREIEAKLFSGRLDGVISTSALEMGIDVGGLDVCVLVGYPGTIINTWQRAGRVGRGSKSSAIVMIAGSDALDQYFVRNPEDLFNRNCEQAIMDPFNEEVIKRHLPCAAVEIPLSPSEPWLDNSVVKSAADHLCQEGALYKTQDGLLHSPSRRPHREVDLRGIGMSFPIFLEDKKTLMGNSSGVRAFSECHEGAVYLHRAEQYVVTKLDLERNNIIVRPSKLQYYTRALSEKETKIIGAPIRSREFPGFSVREARLEVTERIVGYEKRRSSGQELIGVVDLQLPPIHFQTVGIWIEIPDTVKESVKNAGLHFMGGIHALEHAAISMFPLFALCDRDDIGGISTPDHEQVCRAAVFIYDGHPGGVGLAHRAFEVIGELLGKTLSLVADCPCEDGCPSCIHSPKCGSGNKPLDKQACLKILNLLLESMPESVEENVKTDNKVLCSDDHEIAKVQSADNSDDLDGVFAAEYSDFVQSKTRRRSLSELSGFRRVVVFDLETRLLAEDVGGWNNIHKMGLSLGVAYTEQDGFTTFYEDSVSSLIELLTSSDLVVGFNHIGFDYRVLSAYTDRNLSKLFNLDILLEIQASLGHRLTLDHLGEFTLGEGKKGSGLNAVKWFREGRWDLLEEYCRDDVRITRDLYRFGLEEGYLLYKPRNGKITRIPVNWRAKQESIHVPGYAY